MDSGCAAIFLKSLRDCPLKLLYLCKNRDIKKFSKKEVEDFLEKLETIKKKENLFPVIGFVFSRNGFTTDAESDMRENGIAYSSDELWLDI
ncbi:MAG: hypothetical protein GY940_20150 [bacterium]|nr:hypothetical protein [bacterium]